MVGTQEMNDIKQDVAIEQCYQEPDGGIELDKIVPLEDDKHLAPLHRQVKSAGGDFPYDVLEQECPDIEENERNEQLVDLADEEAEESLVGFEKDAGDEEVQRHAKTGYHGAFIEFGKCSANVRHDHQDDTDSFGKVYEINAFTYVFSHTLLLWQQR